MKKELRKLSKFLQDDHLAEYVSILLQTVIIQHKLIFACGAP